MHDTYPCPFFITSCPESLSTMLQDDKGEGCSHPPVLWGVSTAPDARRASGAQAYALKARTPATQPLRNQPLSACLFQQAGRVPVTIFLADRRDAPLGGKSDSLNPVF